MPTTPQRGYGYRHQRLRAAMLPHAYGTPCQRCGQPMLTGQPLDLDHTDDRKGYKGFSHAACNRSTAGHNPKGIGDHVASPKPRPVTRW